MDFVYLKFIDHVSKVSPNNFFKSFDQLVTMRSKCGSSVEVLSSINHDVEDYWLSKRNRGFFELFYPGQEVVCILNLLYIKFKVN